MLDVLGVEPGRISGALARLLCLLTVVAPYQLAARLVWLVLGVKVSAMGVWRVTQRLGEAAARYSEQLSQYHDDSRSPEVPGGTDGPAVVVVSVDGCALGMQVHKHRRHRQGLDWLADLELEARNGRAVERRFHFSRLHGQHSIDSFLFQQHKSRQQNKARILRLLDLDFLDKGTNIVLVGNPGTGKTFLSKIIGWRACQANRRVLFTTAMDMLNQLTASQVDHSLVRRLKFYTDPTLLICD